MEGRVATRRTRSLSESRPPSRPGSKAEVEDCAKDVRNLVLLNAVAGRWTVDRAVG